MMSLLVMAARVLAAFYRFACSPLRFRFASARIASLLTMRERERLVDAWLSGLPRLSSAS
jgi:hypothetical protein